ncbi:MAG: Ribosomal protein L7/L12 C-terminal domain [Bacteriophage sp.]|nr:MAG: Ribosomal protein L7/L12 C-terminal domain [Bacteriophage sp.]
MLNVTIQNDGKIKIQSECSNTKEMRSNVNLIKTTKGLEETKLAANAAVEIMRNMVDQHEPKDNGKCDLVLVWVDQDRKLIAVKELKENLDLWLRDAKGYIDSYCAGKKPVLLTGYEDEVTKVAKKLESSECLKVCISKH